MTLLGYPGIYLLVWSPVQLHNVHLFQYHWICLLVLHLPHATPLKTRLSISYKMEMVLCGEWPLIIWHGNKQSNVLILVLSTENGIKFFLTDQFYTQKLSLAYQQQRIYYHCYSYLIITTTLVGFLCICKIWKYYNIKISYLEN